MCISRNVALLAMCRTSTFMTAIQISMTFCFFFRREKYDNRIINF